MGGCGVGHCKTLKKAEGFLLEKAKAYCQRQIEEGQKVTEHYTVQLARQREGLIEVKEKKQ